MIPKELLEGMEEVEIFREDRAILVIPVLEDAREGPILKLARTQS